MVKLSSPFLVNIKFTFQNETKLYIVSDFIQQKLYLGFETLFKNNMVYRDLKPENILMDSEGHIKLTDFDLSKILDDSNNKAFELCGTPQYLFFPRGFKKFRL